MRKRLVIVVLMLSVDGFPAQLRGQFSDPRTYDNSPVGVNQVELDYAFAHSDTSIDNSLIVAGAKLHLNQGSINYTHYFGFLHRMGWAEASLPIAGLGGSITGTDISGSTTGTGDSEYQVALLLRGGPALSVAQFAQFKPTSTVGVSLSVTAPTGQYDPTKVLNLGSDRWSFKPEFAYSLPFGTGQRWELNAYGNIYFYTDNTSYRGTEILRQQALPGFEGHISYSFKDNVWASLDTRYSFRGDTFLNGVSQNDGQQNFLLGAEISMSLNPRNTLIVEVGKALAHVNGPSVGGFGVKYDYTWGDGTK